MVELDIRQEDTGKPGVMMYVLNALGSYETLIVREQIVIVNEI